MLQGSIGEQGDVRKGGMSLVLMVGAVTNVTRRGLVFRRLLHEGDELSCHKTLLPFLLGKFVSPPPRTPLRIGNELSPREAGGDTTLLPADVRPWPWHEEAQTEMGRITQAEGTGDRGGEGQPEGAEGAAVAVVAGTRATAAELQRSR
jgi:hypothetical protein